MTVTWTTWAPARSEVQFGAQLSGPLPFRAQGTASTFTDGGVLRRKLYIHRVTLRKLTPGAQYGERAGRHAGLGPGWRLLCHPRETLERNHPGPGPQHSEEGGRVKIQVIGVA